MVVGVLSLVALSLVPPFQAWEGTRQNRILSRHDILFSADVNVVSSMYVGGPGSRRGRHAFLHPLFPPLARILGDTVGKGAESSLGRARAAAFLASLIAGVLVFFVALLLSRSPLKAAAILLVFTSSFSFHFFSRVPERSHFDTIGIVMMLVLAARGVSRAIPWNIAGIYSVGMTVTNLVPLVLFRWGQLIPEESSWNRRLRKLLRFLIVFLPLFAVSAYLLGPVSKIANPVKVAEKVVSMDMEFAGLNQWRTPVKTLVHLWGAFFVHPFYAPDVKLNRFRWVCASFSRIRDGGHTRVAWFVGLLMTVLTVAGLYSLPRHLAWVMGGYLLYGLMLHGFYGFYSSGVIAHFIYSPFFTAVICLALAGKRIPVFPILCVGILCLARSRPFFEEVVNGVPMSRGFSGICRKCSYEGYCRA